MAEDSGFIGDSDSQSLVPSLDSTSQYALPSPPSVPSCRPIDPVVTEKAPLEATNDNNPHGDRSLLVLGNRAKLIPLVATDPMPVSSESYKKLQDEISGLKKTVTTLQGDLLRQKQEHNKLISSLPSQRKAALEAQEKRLNDSFDKKIRKLLESHQAEKNSLKTQVGEKEKEVHLLKREIEAYKIHIQEREKLHNEERERLRKIHDKELELARREVKLSEREMNQKEKENQRLKAEIAQLRIKEEKKSTLLVNSSFYEHIKFLGSGNHATVHLVENWHDKKQYALKLIRWESSADLTYRQQKLKEGEDLAQLTHRNVVRYYCTQELTPPHEWRECAHWQEVLSHQPKYSREAFVNSPSEDPFTYLCILMEYCMDGTLSDWMSKNPVGGSRSSHKTIKYFSQVLEGVLYVRKKIKCHGDLFDKNILISEDNVKIGDFGSSICQDDRDMKNVKVIFEDLFLPDGDKEKHPDDTCILELIKSLIDLDEFPSSTSEDFESLKKLILEMPEYQF